MKNSIKACQIKGLSKSNAPTDKPINLLAFSKDVEKTELGEVWTKVFRKALEYTRNLLIPKGKYYIDDTIIIPSNTKIRADKKAEICLVRDTKVVMFRNADVIDGSKRAVGHEEPISENITIKGGVWSTEYRKRAEYGKICAFDKEDSKHGVHALMLFSGVKNLHLSEMVFKDTPAFALQLGRIEDFIVEKIKFVSCYADGVHVNGFVKNGFIKNITGEVGDDLVALNAYDWDNSTINNGPMENLRIENIRVAATGEYKSFRIQAGVVPTESGDIDCYIRDLYIKNVKGVSVFKMYLQTPSYKEEPDGTKVGRLENITIDGVELDLPAPVDQMKNYTECDPLTGNFGAFELGSNISKLTIYNVKAKINKERYPTLHLITAGPKSSYLPEWGIELFDPYVVSETEEIVYKNIRVNGKKITDLRTEIKEVSFPDTMYEGQYGNGGSGKVKSVKNERKI